MRRIQPNWLNENDELILELLGKSGVAINKRGVELNLELNDKSISYSTIKRRIDKLAEAGFVEQVREEGSYYCITGKGVRYLTGSPYGAATAGDEPVEATEVEPLDYEILDAIHNSDEPPAIDEIVTVISADPDRIRTRIENLISNGTVTETSDNNLTLTLGGQYILQMFRLSSDMEEQADRYGVVDLEAVGDQLSSG